MDSSEFAESRGTSVSHLVSWIRARTAVTRTTSRFTNVRRATAG
jgi:hypothetical protein